MIGDFFEWLLGDRAKAIVLAIGAIGTLLAAIVALLEYRRRKQRDEEIERLQALLKSESNELSKRKDEADEREKEIFRREEKLQTLRRAVLISEDELWRIHEAAPFSAYADWIAGRRPIVITVANLKGGVGKTTLTTSLAAYFDLGAKKRVLAIDLDYQGSLSNMMLSAVKETDVSSKVNKVLEGTVRPGAYEDVAVQLSPVLPRTSVIPSYYSLAPLENRLMVEWLLQETGDDVRYRLAQFLAHKNIGSNFDVVLIDVPPRLTTGTINALCSSTHLLVPTVMDRTSAEAVGTFLRAAKHLKAKLNPGLELLGVVGTLTHEQKKLHESEEKARIRIAEQLPFVWGPNQMIFERHIPRKMAFSRAAGEGIAYVKDKDGDVQAWMNSLGGEIRLRAGL